MRNEIIVKIIIFEWVDINKTAPQAVINNDTKAIITVDDETQNLIAKLEEGLKAATLICKS